MFSFAILVLCGSVSLIDGRDSKKQLTFHQIDSNFSVKSGPTPVLSMYHKFNKSAPNRVQNAAAVCRGTVIASSIKADAAYLIPITIGRQTLNLEVDTSLDSFWAFSSDFASVVPSTYNSSNSNTSRLQKGHTWSTCYLDQSWVAGEVYIENVSAGGITVKNQIIGVARRINSQIQLGNGREGVLGLSFNSRNSIGIPRYTSFFDNVKSTLSAPRFTADLKKGKPGSFDFGFIDDSKYTGNITYVPVDTSQGLWGFTMDGFAIEMDKSKSITANMIADTSTSIVYLPEKIVNAYYAGVSDAVYNKTEAGYIFPCGTALPSITFDIGSYSAVVPGSFIEYAPTGRDGITCFGGIQSAGDSGPFILGDVFLKSQFIVFEAGKKPRIGFAAKPL